MGVSALKTNRQPARTPGHVAVISKGSVFWLAVVRLPPPSQGYPSGMQGDTVRLTAAGAAPEWRTSYRFTGLPVSLGYLAAAEFPIDVK